MKTALITGITGQDGSYLADILLAKGYAVVGLSRNPDQARRKLHGELADQVEILLWDMRDLPGMNEILAQVKPQHLYNFAAYSSGAGMFDDPIGIADVNGVAVSRMLEAIRQASPATRFCQASSSEMFGFATESPQTEETAFHPRTPYGAAKLYAHNMINIYRRHYGIFACSAILYNHESPRRGEDFVTRKVTRGAAAIKLGLADSLDLGTLEARRDWGYAKDYVDAMRLMLEQEVADDYVIASGSTHSIRDLCQCAFSYLDLDYRNYVNVVSGGARAQESVQLVGDASKIERQLGWRARLKFEELIHLMVDHELAALQ